MYVWFTYGCTFEIEIVDYKPELIWRFDDFRHSIYMYTYIHTYIHILTVYSYGC